MSKIECELTEVDPRCELLSQYIDIIDYKMFRVRTNKNSWKPKRKLHYLPKNSRLAAILALPRKISFTPPPTYLIFSVYSCHFSSPILLFPPFHLSSFVIFINCKASFWFACWVEGILMYQDYLLIILALKMFLWQFWAQLMNCCRHGKTI